MEDIDKLLCARWVVPIAPKNIALENHAIAIKDGKILGLMPIEEAKEQYCSEELFHYPDHVLMPGLINAHTHSPMNLFRGLADDLALMDWLNNHIWPAENDLINANSVTDGCRMAIAEMLRGGITCFNDMYFFPNETAQACIEEGLRACIGLTIMNVPTGWAKNEDEYIKKAEDAYQNRPESPLIHWSVAPHATYTNSDSSLKKAKQLADEYDLVMNMHVHETLQELEIDLKNHEKRPLHRLYDLGLLDNKFIAVHMVHLIREEIELIKETGAHVVHCPESNLKLASGFAPISALLSSGINVAIGTDGAASNNDLDLFAELRIASMLAKATMNDPTVLPAEQALEMATINGARALHLDHEIGSIEPGKSADIIAINLNHLFTQPTFNPISHLAYAINRLQVSDVWVAGKPLLKNYEFTQLDLERTIAQGNQWAAKARKYQANRNNLKKEVTL